MKKSNRVRSAFAGVSLAAALASPTFGINISFNAAESSITYFHDAEDGDPVNIDGTTVRTPATVTGNNIPSGSAPGFQLNTGTVFQNGGGAVTGSSTGRIGIGHVEDIRTATMTIQSLTFVNQNEVNTTDTTLKMDGNSIISADFKLVWTATGNYGPPLIGRISIPISATVVGAGTASVNFTGVKWEVDQIIDGIGTNVFEARPGFTGGVSFTSSSPSATTLSSSSTVLKNQVGQTLQLKNGDQFILSGRLTFAADGNSPADILFNFGNTGDYEDAVLANDPLRFYRLNETNDFQNLDLGDNYIGPPLATRYALDSSGHNQHGQYVGDVTPEANTAQFSMGTAAYFPPPPIITASVSSLNNVDDPDVILAPNTPDIQFGDGQAFTLEAWISRTDFIGFGDGYFASIIDAQDENGNGFRLGINNDSLLLSGGFADGFEGTDAFAFLGEEGSFFQTGEFYHIVAVYNGDGTVEFFVNGVSVGSEDYTLLTDSLDEFMRIGNDIYGFAQFPGIIDEVAIYGTALTSVQVLDHFQRGVEDSNLLPVIGLEIDQAFAVPEPATALLGFIGVAAVTMRRRRGQD